MKRHQSHASLRISKMAAICDFESKKVGCLESIYRRMAAIYAIIIVNLNFIKNSKENKIILLQ